MKKPEINVDMFGIDPGVLIVNVSRCEPEVANATCSF